ncbi:UvrD-helicase domain-containing protein [Marinobacter sp.]|uniref:UvrD-helicase domain-containing protein n=1 Tax=Marinobacter sp. TaxID=50741 RepID=UPI003A950842
MTSHSDAKKIAPHWLMRLFGAEAATFVLDENGLQVTTRGGERYLILSESLASEAVLEEGMFLSRLVLQTNLGPKVFSGLRKQDANALFGWLREHWLKELAPDVVQAAATVRRMLEHGYPRTSKVSDAIHLAHAAKVRFRRVPEPQWCTHLSDDEVAAFGYLSDVASWDQTAIEVLRTSYVSQQLERYTGFFDQVESKPLTEKQREACVIDEDNNLVLAGAGTGKTSTMIGRAGYLLESGQARAEEILLLAFANKAATEMQQRSQRRLGDAGLSISTFHKLGKEIIAAVEGQQPALTALAEDDRALASHVNTWFESHLQVPAYRQLVLKYFRDHLYPDANPFDFKATTTSTSMQTRFAR